MNGIKDSGYINLWHSYTVHGNITSNGKIFDTFVEADEDVGSDRYGFYGTFRIERVQGEPVGNADTLELYEALEYVMTAHGEQLSDAFEKAQAALSNARGESRD